MIVVVAVILAWILLIAVWYELEQNEESRREEWWRLHRQRGSR